MKKAPTGTALEVFRAFLKLGLTSFGGPVAHIGYFRDELVVRRKWLTEENYADLLALCQFLPGPASSQLGFALGLLRAGWGGAIAAFLAFTLPSAVLLTALALAAVHLDGDVAHGLIHGLKIVAVAIVAQAVWGMARTLCPDATRAAIALSSMALITLLPGSFGMMAAIGLGGLAGMALCGASGGQMHQMHIPVGKGVGITALACFTFLFAVLPIMSSSGQGFAMIDGFYRAGALVFGGGHVVLPLLEAETVARGWISSDTFITGYGLAQAVPGPLFTFAAWLGAAGGSAPNGILGAMIALIALFAPGFLLLIAALPFWGQLRARPHAQTAMQGANAAVVGILGLALYDPVFLGGINGRVDIVLAAICFVALVRWRIPPWAVVAGAAAGRMLIFGLA
ncbi:chromate efflux transporter [Falsirhodobacter sp. alg1]|uniref:chromate efflux transporter n=1 Tax=Falsirhodobacter sp. alg1 TaxID=1472418 RepID=UPI000B0F0951|nr:chromate efflux transporter [Falsirhodobacter sp. alg1]